MLRLSVPWLLHGSGFLQTAAKLLQPVRRSCSPAFLDNQPHGHSVVKEQTQPPMLTRQRTHQSRPGMKAIAR